MTKTTKPARHTAAQVAAGWRAIERHAYAGNSLPAAERIEIGSADSGFDAPPPYPSK